MGNSSDYFKDGEGKVCKMLTDPNDKTKWNMYDEYGTTLLQLACEHRYETAALLIIEKYETMDKKKNWVELVGSDRSSRVRSALFLACKYNLGRVVVKLLEFKRFLRTNFVDELLVFMVDLPSSFVNQEALLGLLDARGIAGEGENLLNYYLMKSKSIYSKAVMKMIALGVDINYQNAEGRTPIMLVSRFYPITAGSLFKMEGILGGYNWGLSDKKGMMVLHYVVLWGGDEDLKVVLHRHPTAVVAKIENFALVKKKMSALAIMRDYQKGAEVVAVPPPPIDPLFDLVDTVKDLVRRVARLETRLNIA